MNLFQKTLMKKNENRPPVWLMRQAGRYHSHYQALRKKHSFIDLCKQPELARETTMGPMRDFDFDAAILFSDLLFPLEAMGMGLEYSPGPKLSWNLRHRDDLSRLTGGKEQAKHLEFQGHAMAQIRSELPKEKGLLGFVGGPLTLFCYAVEGSHQGKLESAREGMNDGRYFGFVEGLVDLLVENMRIQADSGADTIAMMDTCAGEFPADEYRSLVVPALQQVLRKFKTLRPDFPVLYYSKGTSFAHWDSLVDLPIEGIGVDWRTPIADVLDRYSDRWVIQGNVDPHSLFLGAQEFEEKTRAVFESVRKLDRKKRTGWVCGLGHGIMPETPEANVRRFVTLSREVFQ